MVLLATFALGIDPVLEADVGPPPQALWKAVVYSGCESHKTAEKKRLQSKRHYPRGFRLSWIALVFEMSPRACGPDDVRIGWE